jgi:DNA-binding MarR family transcriptional regulator
VTPDPSLTKTTEDSKAGTEKPEFLLRLLSAVERNSSITQRVIALDLGIALGLANTYLKRCVKKGLIKVAMAPANRYSYYLTPKGLAEKSRLTAEFLRQSFNLVRTARSEFHNLFATCANRGWRRVVLVGAGELGEIATLSAIGQDVEVVGFVDASISTPTVAGLPVRRSVLDYPTIDAALIADLGHPQDAYESVASHLDPARILFPRFLPILRAPQPTLTPAPEET